jgi:thiamine phosphate synthase YjbQ (UPF0047 family)
MNQRTETLAVPTRRGLNEITGGVNGVVRASGVREGLCTVFIRHTSASLVIQENADPAVQRDLEAFLSRLVPERRSPLHPRRRGACPVNGGRHAPNERNLEGSITLRSLQPEGPLQESVSIVTGTDS